MAAGPEPGACPRSAILLRSEQTTDLRAPAAATHALQALVAASPRRLFPPASGRKPFPPVFPPRGLRAPAAIRSARQRRRRQLSLVGRPVPAQASLGRRAPKRRRPLPWDRPG